MFYYFDLIYLVFLVVFFLQMITDNDLGFIANFLGIFIFALVIAYHYVLGRPEI
ncbi:putative oligosaccaryltransferase, oligosaccharyltransferase subunit ost4p superfamily [Helianthus annuus]|nr:putative oligosaccaryltransferase, oligosaccharyltransferase subunit ost4p superfamily [Helianthus annuus]